MSARKRIVLSLLLFAGVFLAGVTGFKILGGPDWSWFDAAYMTVITVSTVGYGEVRDLAANPAARTFAGAFILLSLGTIAFAVSSITAFVVEGELKQILGRRKMEKDIARLRDHVVVCGADETARSIAAELLATRRDFVLVEPAREKIDRLLGLGAFPYVEGDPAEDEVLLRAGVERARGILLSLPTDEANLFVAVSARSLNPKIRIVAKAIDLKSQGKMKKAGADHVVSPTHIGGMRMVSQLVRPAVVSFLDVMLREGRGDAVRFEDVFVRSGSPLIGKGLAEAELRDRPGALLVGLRRGATGEHIFNPPPDTLIGEGDALILIATPDGLRALERTAAGG